MTFYLGTHQPGWLTRTEVPLCVSRRRLADYKRLPVALGPWILDSGGFTELSTYGEWRTTPEEYVAEVRRFAVGVGRLVGAACQDWMCEPVMLEKTGLTVAKHQRRTVDSYRELRALAPELPWFPVLQGWEPADYVEHVQQYERAGVDLRALPLVGLGSVCRRQHTGSLVAIFSALAPLGLRLHGFGVKRQGLRRIAPWLASSDSMAWSSHARKRPALPGCDHRNCANCFRYALLWQQQVLGDIRERRPLALQCSLAALGGAA